MPGLYFPYLPDQNNRFFSQIFKRAQPRKANSMSATELKLPSYREQSREVAARFEHIRQRPVILQVDELKKSFGTNGKSHVVFDKVSLNIYRREFVCVVGASGCGK